MTSQKNQSNEAKPKMVSVACLSSDYDGTISPLNVPRIESRVPMETRVMLRQISRFLPISIITMKDLPFIMPRTPFAQAWSAIGGLEMRIGRRVLKKDCFDHGLANISRAIDYARSQTAGSSVEIEDKQDSEGDTIAFCVDWRQTRHSKTAWEKAERVAIYCEALGLKVIRYEKRPFYDVYPVAPDKGWALQKMLAELGVENNVLYLGDSEMDNSAFRASKVSLGVIHDETPLQTLDCDYFVKFEYVPDFLNALLANNLLFSPDFPMIKNNPNRNAHLNQQNVTDEKRVNRRG